MNIFFLDHDLVKCAQAHCNKHVVKMIVEYAQLLSTAHRMLDGTRKLVLETDPKTGKDKWKWRWVLPNDLNELLLKDTHHYHPSAVWVRESSANYDWLCDLLRELTIEYTHRYSKVHSYAPLLGVLWNKPNSIPEIGLTSVRLAMPDEYKTEDAVESYREYYRKGKTELLQYKNREIPTWL